MSLTCHYEQITSSYTLGELSRDVMIETKLKMPDNVPKADSVIGGNFQTSIPTVMVDDNLLTVSGVIYPQLLYQTVGDELTALHRHHEKSHEHDDHDDHDEDSDSPREPKEHSYTWSGDDGIIYDERIEVPGLQADSVVEVRIIPKVCDFERNGSERINFTAKITLLILPTNHRQSMVISDLAVQPLENINVSKEQLTTEQLSAIKQAALPVQASLMLPNIKPGVSRILNCVANVANLNWEYNRGRIYLKGVLDIGVIYVGHDDDDLPTEVLMHEWNRESDHAVPFETYFETEVPEEGLLVVPSVTVADTRIEIKSHRELHCHMNLNCQAAISTVRSQEIAIDAVPNHGTVIDTQKTLLNIEEYLGEVNGEIAFEHTADLPAGQPGAERLLSYQGQLLEPKVEIAEGNAAIEGGLDLKLLYTAEGAEGTKLSMARWEARYNNNLPVAGMIDFPNLLPGSFIRVHLTLDLLKLEPVNDRAIKVTGQVKVRLLAKAPRTMTVLSDCAEVIPVDPETRPSMMFYIVQPGDTLWRIARRYQTTMAQLIHHNQISNPERIEVNQKILIPKHVVTM